MKSKRILLPNGCSCSTPSVNPKDWKTCNKSALQKDWRIQYYFYDPNFPKPTNPIVIKGMNSFKDLAARREITKALIDDEFKALKDGYNPYLKKYTQEKPQLEKPKMNPDLKVIEAFRLAHEKLKGTDEYLDQVRYAINRFEKALIELQLSEVTIYNFKRSQLKETLDYINLTDNYYNKFKAYFSSLFKELIEYECCEVNLTRDIQKRSIVKKQREFLEVDKLSLVLEYLRLNYPEFYRYGKVFFYSGARSTELFSVQMKHVRLEKQEYDLLLKKGKQYVWETKVIIQDAIPFWTEIVQKCNSKDDYLFSYGLVPGTEKNNSKQITIRWRKHVKNKVAFYRDKLYLIEDLKQKNISEYESITADFYAMKHTFLDLLDSMNENAMGMASHRKENTTKIYTAGRERRKNESLKSIRIFAE
ncbi:site-specific integrase [Flavobacterium sp.]|uniref:site-specific integrase n=1 Tax=Flavobacterium sp. TaxID=239 RepID=UPI0026334810|nr:site-specific integrase [Flavobacterium sp.]